MFSFGAAAHNPTSQSFVFACLGVASDVKALQMQPSAPDSTLAALFAQAVQDFAGAATACSAATQGRDPSRAEEAAADVVAGGKLLVQVQTAVGSTSA